MLELLFQESAGDFEHGDAPKERHNLLFVKSPRVVQTVEEIP
jgi:hypothetical protein